MTKRKESRTFKVAVLHVNPDVEAIASYDLIRYGFIEGIELTFDHTLKFIPSGPLRPQDWKDDFGGCVDVPVLESLGVLFIDCGGGFLDHHAQVGDRCTLEILEQDFGFSEGSDHDYLHGMVRVIADQDKKGKALDFDRGYKTSSWPHTQRTLRNLISGWNLRYEPKQVVFLASVVLQGVMVLCQQLTDAENRRSEGNVRSADIKGRGLFILDKMLSGIEQVQACENYGITLDLFKQYCQGALQDMESEWDRARRDFHGIGAEDETKTAATIELLRSGDIVYQDNCRRSEQIIVLCHGFSKSRRFGQYARMQVSRYARKRGLQSAETVVIQHWDDQHFTLSVGAWDNPRIMDRPRMVLDHVAASLRAADIGFRGGQVHLPEVLLRPGNVDYFHKGSKKRCPIFMPDFRTVVGNSFFTNPYMPETRIRPDVLVDIVRSTLQGETMKCHRGGCTPQCRWHGFRLLACRLANPQVFSKKERPRPTSGKKQPVVEHKRLQTPQPE